MYRGEIVSVTAEHMQEWCAQLIEKSPHFPAL